MTICIYPVTDIKTIRGKQDGHYGYLLQAVDKHRVMGYRIAWEECCDDTQGALIRAITEAAGRITAGRSNVLILSDNKPILDGILNLHKWQQDGWKRSRGREIKRKESWRRISKSLKGMNIAAQMLSVEKTDHLMLQIQKV